jgi:2-polyprenyl-3-methyl-5-hydroxy-6-metoxy-1,4-benzoquinol methylase
MGIDLSRRNHQPEIMDAPGLPHARFTQTLKGLRRINTVTRSAALMWPDLKAAAGKHPSVAPLRVLDVACGGGDVLLALSRWSERAGMSVEFAGCDLSPAAVQFASEAAARAGAPIAFFQLDVKREHLPSGFDMIMSTLFLHHLAEEDALAFLRNAAAKARRRLVVQDLVRSPLSYWFARLGTSVLLLNDICRLDGRTSVEGAFTLDEAHWLVRKAGLTNAEVMPHFPFRYLIRWVRT